MRYTLIIILLLLFSFLGNATVVIDSLPCDSVLAAKYNDTRGNGDPFWNGIRNVRAVLPGLLYRSGGNSLYNSLSPRSNDNPITFQGVLNLYEAGFDKVFYLYSTRFATFYPDSVQALLSSIGISYESVVPRSDSAAFTILRSIYASIQEPNPGRILVHCWNGWHMSGLASAFALMQFCNFRPVDALAYWERNTDNNYKGYEKLKKQILDFTPDPALVLMPSQRSKYCPCDGEVPPSELILDR
jgi:hypothetical protein